MKNLISLFSLVALFFSGLHIANAQAANTPPPYQEFRCPLLTVQLEYKDDDEEPDDRTNGEVTILQDFLVKKGYLTTNIFGYYGPSTRRAVQSFQRDYNITTNGRVGPMTMSKINSIACQSTLQDDKKKLSGKVKITNPSEQRISRKIGESIIISWEATQNKIASTTLGLFLQAKSSSNGTGGMIQLFAPSNNVQNGSYGWRVPEYIIAGDVGVPLLPGEYKIRAVLYEGEVRCVGFCPPGVGNANVLSEDTSDKDFVIEPKGTNTSPIVSLVTTQLAAKLGVVPSAISFVSIEEQTFSNGCLDIPQPSGMFCTMALVEGYVVLLNHNGTIYRYHTNLSGSTISEYTRLTNAPAPPIISHFTAGPDSITLGQSTTLSWSSNAEESCSIRNMTTNSLEASSVSVRGSKVVSPTQTTTYKLICVSPATEWPTVGSLYQPFSEKLVTVTVGSASQNAPTISHFTVSPTVITSGQEATLSWSSNANSSCSIQNLTTGGTELSSGQGSGSKQVTPSQTTTYKLTCNNVSFSSGPTGSSGGLVFTSAEKTVSVTVNSTLPSPNTLGSYRLYFGNNTYASVSNNSITRANALANCMQNKEANPTLSVRCTWNGTEIYNSTTPTVSPTATIITSPLSATVGGTLLLSGTAAGMERVYITTSKPDGSSNTSGITYTNGVWYQNYPAGYFTQAGNYVVTIRSSDSPSGQVLASGTIVVTAAPCAPCAPCDITAATSLSCLPSPTVTVTNSSASQVTFSYTNAPANSQVVIIEKATGNRIGSVSTYISNGGSGSASMPSLSLSPGSYSVRLINYSTKALLAESGTFTITQAVVATLPIITIESSSSLTVQAGDNGILRWTVSPAGTPCTLKNLRTGVVTTNISPRSLADRETTEYMLTCTGAGGTVTKTVTFTVLSATAAPTITTTSLSSGTVGVQYESANNVLTSSGGVGTRFWSVMSGSLPPGVTLNIPEYYPGPNGEIAGHPAEIPLTGVPTTAGTYTFTVRVTVGTQNATKQLTITVNPSQPATDTYRGYRADGTVFITTANITRAEALTNCTVSNAATSYRCTWGTEVIYERPVPITDTYRGYRADGTTFITTNNITRADALANCTTNSHFLTRCTWGTEVIYERPTTFQAIGYGVYTGVNGQVNVTLPTSANGKVLVLTGYDDVTWVISNPNNVTLAKIIAIGYNPQQVTGISGVEVESHSYRTDRIYKFAYTTSGSSFTSLVTWLAEKGITLTSSNFKGAYSSGSFSMISTAPQVLGVSSVCVDLPFNFHRGNESPSTKKLQSFLIERGFMEGEVTGFYGDKTVSAVKDYQMSKGLPITGMVYDFTRAAIKADSCQ